MNNGDVPLRSAKIKRSELCPCGSETNPVRYNDFPLVALGRTKKLTALATIILVLAAPTTYAGLSNQHPIHGQWAWTFERNSCTEVYQFTPDNIARVTSGAEIAESRFTLSEKPDQNGFYRMTDTVTKSNGQTGCDGTAGGTPVGHEVTSYLILNATRDKLLICGDASLNQCIGPLQRVGK